MMKHNSLNLEFLKTLLSYNPDTGAIAWNVKRGRSGVNKYAGGVNKNDGYAYVNLNKKRILAHRLAWALHYGEWPETPLDHINMIRSDNRIANLRKATVAENNRNRTKQSNNSTGYKGVTFHKIEKKFHAKIMVNKQRISLGYFNTAEEASAAYIKASEEHHGQFARN